MRIGLRRLETSDAAPTAALITPTISRWTATWPPSMSADEAGERIALAREREARGSHLVRAVRRLSDDALLGWISLARPDGAARTASLGYWLGEPFHGHGYMAEAAAEFVALAWRSLDIDVLEAAAQPQNAASISILTKLGMRYVGDRSEFTPNRGRNETCAYFELRRPT
jgi:ribosomal-protein-alanine N-acetyltransferase